MLFDSHCHLTDERLIGDVDPVLDRARAAGVGACVTVGTDLEDADRACVLAARAAGVWAAVGIHPHVADRADDAAMDRIAELAGQSRVVALGETGLDFHYDNAPRAAQRAAFERHFELARRLGLPVIVHSRDADDETATLLAEHGRDVSGVLHCFTGGRRLLEAGLDAGWYVSFSGIASFRKYDRADLVRAVPPDRLLIETDSPYLAPVPVRGRRNEPAFLPHVAAAVARLLGRPPEEVEDATYRNACSFYRL